MVKKLCSKCQQIKYLSEFNKDRYTSLGLDYKCKECQIKRNQEYKKNNKDKIIAKKNAFEESNPELIQLKRELKKIRERERYLKIKDNPEFKAERQLWRDTHKIDIKNYHKTYKLENKDKILISSREYKKRKRKEDLTYLAWERLRCRSRAYLKAKNRKTPSKVMSNYIGLSKEDLIEYLKTTLYPDENGVMLTPEIAHIDHIIPLACFDPFNEEDLKKALHYTNLQYLWPKDNFKKHDNPNWVHPYFGDKKKNN